MASKEVKKKDPSFKVKKITDIKDLKVGVELPESDLTIQDGGKIIQFDHVEEKDKRGAIILKPGTYNIANGTVGLTLSKTELGVYKLLETIDNTSKIISEADKFMGKIEIYKKLSRPPKRAILLCSPPGVGKCLHPDQGVIMYDGTIKKAKNILQGDKLMGPDSKCRNVLSVSSGEDEMYKVTPTNGDSYIVNSAHILSLQSTDTKEIVNISVSEYLKQSEWFREKHKGYRSDVINFECNSDHNLPLDPYILGLWLGDGHSATSALTSMDDLLIKSWTDYGHTLQLQTRVETLENNKSNVYHLTNGVKYGSKGKNYFHNCLNSLNLKNNKHIPHDYKTSSISNRLHLLAGLIDSDGSLSNGCYEIVQKNTALSEDILYVARSLGFAAYRSTKIVKNIAYNRIIISGNISSIPVRLERKKAHHRKQIKNHLLTDIKVESIGRGRYNGFTLDGDHLFLLKDFTVTHNTAAINKVCRKFIAEDPKGTSVVIWDTSSVRSSSVNSLFQNELKFHRDVKRLFFIIEDIGGGTVEESYGPKGADSSLLNLLDGVGEPFQGVPTFIIATTNNPEQGVAALIDRPGRFDKVIELDTPSEEESIELLKFISQRDLEEEEIEAAKLAAKNKFSIAHLQEVVVRSMIDDASYLTVVKQLVKHKERFKNAFQDPKTMGIGFGR